jgi:class 3 adenylate cyclase/tetratricopeptide (TPR) repeat protein
MAHQTIRFAPAFIEEMASAGRTTGRFRGSALVADIPGFTSLTETFIRMGPEGAEKLSLLLGGILGSAAEVIGRAGGFVGGFAGDAITGVFPGLGIEAAQDAAAGIHSALARTSPSPGLGSSAKVGVSQGGINWLITSCNSRLFYCFRGEAIMAAADVQESCPPGQSRVGLPAEPENVRGLPERETTIPGIIPSLPYVPDRVFSLDAPGEFRTVVSVFLSADADFHQGLAPGFVSNVLRVAEDFGGYLSGAEVKPSGSALLIVFGAPVSHEDDVARSDQFLRTLFAACSGRLRAGVEAGTVFAGVLGGESHSVYTVIGRSVNLAARLMTRSVWGRVLAGPSYASRSTLRPVRTESLRIRGLTADESVAVLSPYSSSEQEIAATGRMLGRDAELAGLCEVADSARATGRAAVVHITGEAGSGKTRLVRELIRERPDLKLHSLPADSVLRKSLNPFSGFLRRHFGLSDQAGDEGNRVSIEDRLESMSSALPPGSTDAGELAAALRRCGPPLASVAGIRWPGSVFETLDPRGRFESLVDALVTFLRALSSSAPRAVVMDDAQCLDGDSISLLERLVAALREEPLTWLVVGRLGEEESAGERLPGPGPDLTISLEMLGRDETAALMAVELGRPPSPAFVGFMHAQTGGNPFFIEQYCRFLLDEDRVAELEGTAVLSDEGHAVPDSINGLIVATLDRLAPRLRKVVQAASVLGREFEVPALEAMLGGSALEQSLHRCTEERIWAPVSERNYAFRHALFRDSAYAMQLSSRLRDLHARAAEAISALHSGDPRYYADLAFHYEKAASAERASDYLELAAAHAARSFLNTEAVDLYTRLVAILGEGWRRAYAMIELGGVLTDSGHWDKAIGVLETALEEARKAGCHRLCAKAGLRLARLFFEKGEDERSWLLLSEAAASLDQEEDLVLRSQLFSVRSNQLIILNEIEKAVEQARMSLDFALRGEEREQILRATGSLGNAYLQLERDEEALRCYEEAYSGASEIGNTQIKALTAGNMALIYRDRGDFERSEVLTREQLALAEESGNSLLACMALGNLGNLMARVWRPDEALMHFRKAAKIASELGSVQHESIARSNLAGHCRFLGLLDEAYDNAAKAVWITRDRKLDYYTGAFLVELGQICYDRGEMNEAALCIEEAKPFLVERGSRIETQILEACLLARTDREEAARRLRKLADDEDRLYAAEAAFLHWRLVRDGDSHALAVRLNRECLVPGTYPWRSAKRLEEMGEDAGLLPPRARATGMDQT